MMMEFLFWISVFLIGYTYAGYPLVLMITTRSNGFFDFFPDSPTPAVSIIVPVYNEEKIIEAKLANLCGLEYPKDQYEIIIVSDASTDRTATIVRSHENKRLRFYELPRRSGKAAALNLGVRQAAGDILVFTDAAIMLEPGALLEVVKPFQNAQIGCVSGEDYIPGKSGEGMYGRYEMFLRNLENRSGSIVGASGCFYAQRKTLVSEFKEGMAPDFFSVLETVSQGYRAITQPNARGQMGHVRSSQKEFQRKVRTLLRGITTLMAFKHLLNPWRYGRFSFALISHKILRWFGGFLLISALFFNFFLITSGFYRLTLLLQMVFYGLTFLNFMPNDRLSKNFLVRVPFFFCVANFSSMIAWVKYLSGQRQEIWEPSRR